MYAPAPPRAKKTSITRSRTACQACRSRRKKCDESKPRCGQCQKLNIDCRPYTQPLHFRQVTFGESPEYQPRKAGARKRKERTGETETTPALRSAAQTDEFGFPDTEPHEDVYYTTAIPSTAQAHSAHTFDIEANVDTIPWNHSASEASKSLVVPEEQEERVAVAVEDAAEQLSLIARTSQDSSVTANEIVPWTSWSQQEKPQPKLYPNPGFSWGGGHQETFYMNVWDTQCLSALHPVFRQFGILENHVPIVQKAILSLSACHMSRMLPQRKVLTASDIPGLVYRPEFQHQAASQEYYQSATKKLREWAAKREKSELNSILAAMILFCSLESSMGNFSGFNIHSNGVRTLLRMRDQPQGPHDTTQLELQNAWKQTHILNWWRRFHFSSPPFQNTPFPKLDEVEDPRERDALPWPLCHRVDILTSLCETLSVLSRATLRGWERPSDLDLEQVADLERELEILDAKMSTWLLATRSSQSQYPITENEGITMDPSDLQSLLPLRFPSHEAAMNCAYWATAKVMFCAAEWTIDQITGTQRYRRVRNDIEGWITLVLRISMAIDWEQCVRFNTHTIGMSGLLLTCVIRSQRLEVGLWVENWLEERRSTVGLEEGSFPVLQILQIIRVINRERRRGYDVCAIFSSRDDGGGAGKFQSYHSQVLQTVVVCESGKETGKHRRKIIQV